MTDLQTSVSSDTSSPPCPDPELVASMVLESARRVGMRPFGRQYGQSYPRWEGMGVQTWSFHRWVKLRVSAFRSKRGSVGLPVSRPADGWEVDRGSRFERPIDISLDCTMHSPMGFFFYEHSALRPAYPCLLAKPTVGSNSD